MMDSPSEVVDKCEIGFGLVKNGKKYRVQIQVTTPSTTMAYTLPLDTIEAYCKGLQDTAVDARRMESGLVIPK